MLTLGLVSKKAKKKDKYLTKLVTLVTISYIVDLTIVVKLTEIKSKIERLVKIGKKYNMSFLMDG